MDKAIVKTDIQIAVPHGCYGRVGECFLTLLQLILPGLKRSLGPTYENIFHSLVLISTTIWISSQILHRCWR